MSLDSQGDGFGVALQSRSPLVIFCEQRGRGGSFQGGGVAVVGAEPLQPPWARTAEDRSRSRGRPLVPSACSRHPTQLDGTGDAACRLGSAGGVAWPWRRLPGCRASPSPRRKCCQHPAQALTPGASSTGASPAQLS